MDGTDAEAVRSEVTGLTGRESALPKGSEDPLLRTHSTKTSASKDPSASNVVLISAVFMLFFGAVCATLYLSGFFSSWADESIDYDLITNLPDENIVSFAYVTAGEDAFKEASSIAGELLGGGLLEKIKKANIAYAQYGGGASGYAVYLESGQSVPGYAENLQDYLYPSITYSGNKLGIEKKNSLGIDYYLIKSPGQYSDPICAWQQGKGIILLYYSSGYGGTNKGDCNSLIGRKYSKKAFEDLLKRPESIRSDLKTDEKPYAQGWLWSGPSDPSIPGSLPAEEKTAYGQLFSDKNGIYLFAAAVGPGEKSAQGTGLCEGGSIIRTSGKEACLKDSTGSGISVFSLSSAMSYERGAGEYTIYAFAYPKSRDKESVKKKAERFIFSPGLKGT